MTRPVVGCAPGADDLFHVGHLNILEHAKQHCDILTAGVVSDEMLELERRFAEVGVEVVCFPYPMRTSSTALRRAVALLDDGRRG
jgi:cytidyltransferase-like protein